MIRLYYSAGAARIVEIQLNSLRTPKYTDGRMAPNATSASHAVHGSAVTRTQTEHSEGLQTKNSEN